MGAGGPGQGIQAGRQGHLFTAAGEEESERCGEDRGGGEGGGEEQKGGGAADQDESVGAGSQGGGERVAEHMIGGDSSQEDESYTNTCENGNMSDTGTRQEECRQRLSQLQMVPRAQSDLTRTIPACNRKHLFVSLREREGETAERALVRLMARHFKAELMRGSAVRACP